MGFLYNDIACAGLLLPGPPASGLQTNFFTFASLYTIFLFLRLLMNLYYDRIIEY